jgi:hypothetical protein
VTDLDLDARYGRSPSARRNTRRIAIAAAIAFAVAFIAWLWWGGLLGAPAQLQARDIGHEIIAEDLVSVSWQLTTEPGATSACAVQALNEAFGIVGWRVIELPASDEPNRTFTIEVRTAEPAVTGLIYRCWLT